MKNSVIIAQSESEYEILKSVSESVKNVLHDFSSKEFRFEIKVRDLESKVETLTKENEELKQKLEKRNQLFSFWPKIRNI